MNELAATVESKDPGAQFQSPCTDVSEGGDGGGAPSFEATQQGAFRGGTDGAFLSANGLACPNIFTGGYNFHSKHELISLEGMEKAVEVIVEMVKLKK